MSLRQAGAAAVVVLALAPSLLFVVALLLTGSTEPGMADADARCQSADCAVAALVRPLLDRPDWRDSPAAQRAGQLMRGEIATPLQQGPSGMGALAPPLRQR